LNLVNSPAMTPPLDAFSIRSFGSLG